MESLISYCEEISPKMVIVSRQPRLPSSRDICQLEHSEAGLLALFPGPYLGWAGSRDTATSRRTTFIPRALLGCLLPERTGLFAESAADMDAITTRRSDTPKARTAKLGLGWRDGGPPSACGGAVGRIFRPLCRMVRRYRQEM